MAPLSILTALTWSAPGLAEMPLDGEPPPAPSYETRVRPVAIRTGVSASLLGGVDRWETGGGASGELQLGAGWSRRRGGITLETWGSSLLQGWEGPWGLDFHGFGGSISGDALGIELGGSGSVARGWAEGRLLPRWQIGRRRSEVVLGAGPVARSWSGGAAPGLVAQAYGRLDLHGRVGSWAHAQARSWMSPVLPDVLWAHAGLDVSPTLDLDLGISGGLGLAWGGDGGLHAGLLASGSRVVRGQLTAAWWCLPGIAVLADVGPEIGIGSSPYQRVRGMVGVRVSHGRMRSLQPPTPPKVQLRFDAPASARVEVAGTFTDWIPRVMEHTAAGWSLELEVGPGVQEYVYLVDGEPVVPPEASQRRDDGFGGINGVLVVQPGSAP